MNLTSTQLALIQLFSSKSTLLRRLLFVCIVLIMLPGCNFQSSPPETEPSEGTEHSEATLSSDTSTIVEESASPGIGLEPPPPTGWVEVLYAGAGSGAWSFEQGLIAALQVLAGEVALDDIASESPTSLEGSGIILEAQHYLRSGDDLQTKAEIERLLNVIAPSTERISEYARPATARDLRPPGHAQILHAETECSKLWEDGFPSGAGIQCFDYKTVNVGSSKIELYYPISQLVPGFTLGYADAALDAIKDALTTYSSLIPPGQTTTLKDVQIVFTLLESTGTSMLAMVPSAGGAQTCQIIVYPLAITDNETAQTKGASTFGVFKQTLAHETFHCYQIWNFPALSDAPWGVQDWWGEGSAEYFSNVVYPTVDSELGFLNTWIVNSSVQSVVNMSYENFGFFQYMANLYGNNAILSLIKALPAQGDEQTQAAELSKYPNIKSTFNLYAQAFMDGKIADTSGAMLNTSPPYIRPEYQLPIAQADTLNLGAAPFVLSRYALTFEPGHLYIIAKTPTGPEGFESARPKDSPGGWGELPNQIVVACQPTTYFALLTTTVSPASDLFNIQTVVNVKDDVGCDECLVGTWDLDLPAFEEYLSAPFKGVDPDFFRIDSMGGLWRLHFTTQSIVTGEYNFFVAYELDQTSENSIFNLLTQVVLDVNGDGTAQYFADGVGHINFIPIHDNFNMEQTVFINGEEVQDGGNFMNGSSLASGIAGTALYSCDGEAGVLYLTNELGGGGLAEPVRYNRVSTTP